MSTKYGLNIWARHYRIDLDTGLAPNERKISSEVAQKIIIRESGVENLDELNVNDAFALYKDKNAAKEDAKIEAALY